MNIQASPDWNVLLEPFQSLFTKPGFRYFCAFVRVFAHLDGRLWVTSVVLSGLLERHWTNFYRFLRSGAWGIAEVSRQVFALCLPVCKDEAERVFVAIDDTVCRKHGKKFDNLGVHYDPMNHDSPYQSVARTLLGRVGSAGPASRASRRSRCLWRAPCMSPKSSPAPKAKPIAANCNLPPG